MNEADLKKSILKSMTVQANTANIGVEMGGQNLLNQIPKKQDKDTVSNEAKAKILRGFM